MRAILELVKQNSIDRSSVETRYSGDYIEKVAAADAAVDYLVGAFESISPSEAAGALGIMFPKKFNAKELKTIENALAALKAIAPVPVVAPPVAEEPQGEPVVE